MTLCLALMISTRDSSVFRHQEGEEIMQKPNVIQFLGHFVAWPQVRVVKTNFREWLA